MFPGHFCQPSKLQARLVKRPELVPQLLCPTLSAEVGSGPAVAGPWARVLPLSGSQFSFCEMEVMKYNYYMEEH